MKLWGGRFEKDTAKLVEDFHSSISFDQRLYKHDIAGSIAHAKMLNRIGVLNDQELEQIVSGLKSILEDIEQGKIQFRVDAEDIHMNIELLLTERIGDTGKKLHTARSRNDQVALDLRLFLRDEIDNLKDLLVKLIETLLKLSTEHLETWMPGYTHLQKAQPITFAHHLVAYVQMFLRDLGRLKDARKRLNVSPLGSGALAGTTFPLEREFVAAELGFDGVSLNSLDGVSDRDFALEFLAAAAILAMHLSRLCEELIIWSSGEFTFVTVDDAYATGSSIMPQKKNPDVAELIRGKTGRVYGNLLTLLTVMKGLPLAYNKDMQEDKECVFDTVDTVKKSLLVIEPMLATLKVNADVMEREAKRGFTNATDLADYLVKKNIPFREAHALVGKLVLECTKRGCALEDLTLEELRQISPVFEQDVYQAISLENCIKKRNVIGGPAPEAVEQAINKSKEILETLKW